MKLIILLFICFIKSAIAIDYYWFQIATDNEIWLRYVNDQINECPQVMIEGESFKMDIFSEKSDKFPLSCKLAFNIKNIPKKINFNDKEIKINFDSDKVKKIAVIGDTGCRVHKFITQDCQENWPFKKIADLVVQHKPDLIVHIGDYIYRENGYEDDWSTWNEDFFEPAGNLLQSNIPVVMVRGNHEDCKRNGNGWFKLLSFENKECNNHSPVYSIKLNNMDFFITDSTIEENLLIDLDFINSKQNQHRKSFILTHRPLVQYNKSCVIDGYTKVFDSLHENIKMIISGHIHLLQLIRLDHRLQLIAGNSGTLLSNYNYCDNGNNKKEYGFTILEFDDYDTVITAYNKDNEEILRKIA